MVTGFLWDSYRAAGGGGRRTLALLGQLWGCTLILSWCSLDKDALNWSFGHLQPWVEVSSRDGLCSSAPLPCSMRRGWGAGQRGLCGAGGAGLETCSGRELASGRALGVLPALRPHIGVTMERPCESWSWGQSGLLVKNFINVKLDFVVAVQHLCLGCDGLL